MAKAIMMQVYRFVKNLNLKMFYQGRKNGNVNSTTGKVQASCLFALNIQLRQKFNNKSESSIRF